LDTINPPDRYFRTIWRGDELMRHFPGCAILLSALAAYAAVPAYAQAVRGSTGEGRIVYPPSFFAAGRPDTAYDMVLLLPAFTFDPGGEARGYEASAGNVLIDGQRPSTKF